jgi:hypothetical protein
MKKIILILLSVVFLTIPTFASNEPIVKVTNVSFISENYMEISFTNTTPNTGKFKYQIIENNIIVEQFEYPIYPNETFNLTFSKCTYNFYIRVDCSTFHQYDYILTDFHKVNFPVVKISSIKNVMQSSDYTHLINLNNIGNIEGYFDIEVYNLSNILFDKISNIYINETCDIEINMPTGYEIIVYSKQLGQHVVTDKEKHINL